MIRLRIIRTAVTEWSSLSSIIELLLMYNNSSIDNNDDDIKKYSV